MHKKYTFVFVLIFTLVLTACGNDTKDHNRNIDSSTGGNGANTHGETDATNELATPVNTGESSDQNTSPLTQNDMLKKMDELNYTEFELEVEYANYQEYEAELEKSSNNMIQSKIEDSLNNVKKTGADAFNDLYPLVKKLTITQQTSKNDAIQEILATFNLPTDYKEFDLKLQFKDGTQLKFEDKK